MEEKLDNEHATDPIKQTRNKREIMSFRDSAIEKISIKNLNFGSKRFRQFKFNVSKGSSLKGLLLRVSKSGRKDFIMDIWFSGKTNHYTIGQFPNIKCKDVEKICLDLANTHQDERGLWIKSPIKTRVDEKRLVEKPDTTLTAGKSLNDVIEDYCKGGFEKDNRVGSRTFKSCQIWLRYMAGYNNRQLLVEFADDDNGEAVPTFRANKHLRINAPRD